MIVNRLSGVSQGFSKLLRTVGWRVGSIGSMDQSKTCLQSKLVLFAGAAGTAAGLVANPLVVDATPFCGYLDCRS